MPRSWKAAAAVAGATLLLWWGIEARMVRVADAAVLPIRDDAAHRKELVDGALLRIERDTERTRLITEKLLADCYARGGCR